MTTTYTNIVHIHMVVYKYIHKYMYIGVYTPVDCAPLSYSCTHYLVIDRLQLYATLYARSRHCAGIVLLYAYAEPIDCVPVAGSY